MALNSGIAVENEPDQEVRYDKAVKGKGKQFEGPSIEMECHACGYGYSHLPGDWHIPDTKENRKKAGREQIQCPGCQSNYTGVVQKNEIAINKQREQELKDDNLSKQKRIEELEARLASLEGEGAPGPVIPARGRKNP